MQKFRIDMDGARTLRLLEESEFKFKIPRYADLLMDTYLVLKIPDIWSPIYHPSENTNNNWSAYNFKWIKNLGTTIIKEVVVTSGSIILHKFTGDYLAAMVERDFTEEKKNLFNKMSGNTDNLNENKSVNFKVSNYNSSFISDLKVAKDSDLEGTMIYEDKKLKMNV